MERDSCRPLGRRVRRVQERKRSAGGKAAGRGLRLVQKKRGSISGTPRNGAATYSPTSSCSTIGARGLNFSVRNGKRWCPAAITTLLFLCPFLLLLYIVCVLQYRLVSYNNLLLLTLGADCIINKEGIKKTEASSFNKIFRVISTARL